MLSAHHAALDLHHLRQHDQSLCSIEAVAAAAEMRGNVKLSRHGSASLRCSMSAASVQMPTSASVINTATWHNVN